MKKNFIGMFMALALLAATAVGCGPRETAQRTVAIATLMSHPALDELQAGLREELAARGWREGQNVRFILRNANQQMQVVPTIANDLAAQNPDLTIAITTPVAQALARVARGPLVFAAVTDPVGAGVVPSLQGGHGAITGTSDAWPFGAQLALIREIMPKAKTLGVLFNPGEAASKFGMEQIRRHAPEHGFELIEGAVNSVTEVRPVAESLVDRVDALYLSSDNTVIGGMAGALALSVERHKPLFAGESGTVERGALATVSIGYKSLGKKTGELADRMLRGERNIPVVLPEGEFVYLNSQAATRMGVELPPAVLRRATRVYETFGQ